MSNPIAPLELTPLELLFVNEDRPRNPANFLIQIDLDGQVDKERFHRAVATAISCHPLLRARIRRNVRGKRFWLFDGNMPAIVWSEEEVDEFKLSEPERIDLGNSTGVRIWVQARPERSKVLFQFHHACTDGIGAYRFIGDLLSAYDSNEGGPADGISAECLDRLRTRCDQLLNSVYRKSRFRRFFIALREGVGYVGPPIVRMHPRRSDRTSRNCASEFPAIVNLEFSAEEHQALKRVTGREQVNVNDLLAAELFLAIKQWNAEHPSLGWGWRRKIRLSVPFDLRSQDDYQTPAANLTALKFVTRHVRDLDTEAPDCWKSVSRSIRQELLQSRNGEAGLLNLTTLDMLAGLPFGALWLSTRATCVYTAVYSNIGDPTRRMLNRFRKQDGCIVAGNLVVTKITGVPPMRPYTNLAVSVFTYRRRLTISVRCDPNTFPLDATKEFAKLLHSRIQHHLRTKID